MAVPSTLEDSTAEVFCTSREYVGDWGEQASGEGVEGEEIGGEEVEGGLATPPLGKEITRVLDTPYGKVWLDQKGNGGETSQGVYDLMQPGAPEYTGSEPLPTARRLFTVHPTANTQKVNEMVFVDDRTDEEEEIFVATVPADLSSLSKNSSTTTSAPISFIGTLPPSSGRLNHEHSPRDIFPEFLVADPTPPEEGKSYEPSMDEKEQSGNATASDDIPDSLPEAFHIANEMKKLRHTPLGVKTYTHKKAKSIAGERVFKTDGEDEGEQISKQDEEQGQIQYPGLSSMPQAMNKAHSREGATVVEESSQLAPGQVVEKQREEVGKMDADGKGGDASETNSLTIISRRPRLKRVRKEVAVEITPYKGDRQGMCDFEAEEDVNHEEDGDIVVEDTKSGVGKKKDTSRKKKEYRKPPKKRARKEETIKEDLGEAQTQVKGFNTQYTFHGSSDEAEAEPPLPLPPKTPKTPKTPARAPVKRGKKLLGTTNPTMSPASSSVGASGTSPRTTKPYEGPSPKIVFSNSSFLERKDAISVLRSLGVKKTNKVTDKDVTHLVVGSGGLVRSR